MLGAAALLLVIGLATIPRNSAAGFLPLTLIVTVLGGIFGAAVGFVGGVVEVIMIGRKAPRGRRLIALAISTFVGSFGLYLLAFAPAVGPMSLLSAVAVAIVSTVGLDHVRATVLSVNVPVRDSVH